MLCHITLYNMVLSYTTSYYTMLCHIIFGVLHTGVLDCAHLRLAHARRYFVPFAVCYMYVYMCVYMCVYIYIYIYIERERVITKHVCCTHIYIHMYLFGWHYWSKATCLSASSLVFCGEALLGIRLLIITLSSNHQATAGQMGT